MTVKVLLTDPVPSPVADRLRAMFPSGIHFDVVATSSDKDFAEAGADAEVLLVGHRPIGVRELALAPRLRFVQRAGAGYDNLDVRALRERNITAAYSPGINAAPLAEHTVLLILALLKRFVEAESATRNHRWPAAELSDRGLGDLAGATIGLVGFGTTGRAVAERLVGFGVSVRYTARRRADPEVEQMLHASYLPLTELLGWASLVSVHVPLTAETHGLLSDTEFARMRPGTLLINTSRGEVVEERALRSALQSGHLAGAGLDVLADESGTNPFADMPQVLVTPHIAGRSRKSVAAAMQIALGNINRYVQGQPPLHPVPGTERVIELDVRGVG
jgi:phosphoglycerate dehydrogenase-like enzyme